MLKRNILFVRNTEDYINFKRLISSISVTNTYYIIHKLSYKFLSDSCVTDKMHYDMGVCSEIILKIKFRSYICTVQIY